MHYYALVKVASTEDIEGQVEAAMAPFREDGGNGFWDWYQIGGRWTGYLSGYEPEKDRRNMRPCRLCGGTGRRDDDLAQSWRLSNPDYGCNGCDDTEQEEAS